MCFTFLARTFKNRREYQIVIIGYFLRLLLLFWDRELSKIFILPGSGGDSEGFHHVALDLANGFSGIYGGYYTLIISYIYRLFGAERVVAQYINVLLGMTTVVILYNIMDLLDISYETRVAALAFACLLPNFAIMNSVLLRESIIILLIAFSIYHFIIWFISSSIFHFILAILFVLGASVFHSGAIAPLFAYTACAMFFRRKEDKFRVSVNTIFLFLLFWGMFTFIQQRYNDLFLGRFSNIESISDVVNIEEARGDSGYNVGIDTNNSIYALIVNTPIRMFYFIASPLPWQWRGINDIIAFFFSALFYFYCYILAFKYLLNKDYANKNIIILLLFLTISSMFVFAWGVSNVGTALRHRDKFIVQYILMYAICRDKQTLFISDRQQEA
ncbi:hypothetical protein AGMMS49992_18860 [Clostridia bacterium]|nr:hypothetical protein AGMMS49992_18860 [Clostridia bacterium]